MLQNPAVSRNKISEFFKSKKFIYVPAKVLEDHEKKAENEIELFKDEEIRVLYNNDENHWLGHKKNLDVGLFPRDFVQLMESKVVNRF